MDQKPRQFDEERAAILCNLAELVVRELEAAWAAQYQRRHSLKLMRAMSCYNQAFLVVDTSAPGWRILHANDSITVHTGASPAITNITVITTTITTTTTTSTTTITITTTTTQRSVIF